MTVPKRSHSVHILPTTSSIGTGCSRNSKNSRFNFCRNSIGFLLNSLIKRREASISTIFSNNMRRNSNGNVSHFIISFNKYHINCFVKNSILLSANFISSKI
uniref:Uncharacterized protein n=1 Tax=Elaeophora elaphi TaxID=1147741 RepID=A0A0R3RLI9_9BILA